MLPAELLRLRSGLAVRRVLRATGVVAPLAADVDHPFFRVLAAELRRPCARAPKRRDLEAPFPGTSLAADVDHSTPRVLRAKHGLLRSRGPVGRNLRATFLGTPLVSDVDHPGFRVSCAELEISGPVDAVGGLLGAVRVRTRVNHDPAGTQAALFPTAVFGNWAGGGLRSRARSKLSTLGKYTEASHGTAAPEPPPAPTLPAGCGTRGLDGCFRKVWCVLVVASLLKSWAEFSN